jgi:GT2 family glycosyltransferase
MTYRLLDVEVTEPLPTLEGADNDTGIAVLVRRHGRPVGFWMEPITENGAPSPAKMALRISRHARSQLLGESVREELQPHIPRTRDPSLTIVICTRDRPDRLRRCLQSLMAVQDSVTEGETGFDILVVDNAPSDDQTRHVVADLCDVRYCQEDVPGLNFARNRAVHETDREFLAYLDDDTVVDRGWLVGLREAWRENPDVGAITGQVLPMELESEAQILFERGGGFRRGFEKARYQWPSLVDEGSLYPCQTGIFGVGCNMAFRRQALLEVGGFDEALDTGPPLPGGGDHDIFYRVIRAGYPLVYEPSFLVFHQHRLTMKQLRDQYWSWGLSVMAFASKAHRSDPALRPRWRRLMMTWFLKRVLELAKAMSGRHELPFALLLRESWGGVVGVAGEYGRSRRRVERLGRRYR